MIGIVNTTDITGIDLDSDWTVIEYDSNNQDGSSLAAIEYTLTPPDFALNLFTQAEFDQFKLSQVWRAAD
tara:strand:+ start:1937 stop:2146 length:210 start_codon:yes stop_codon:yes gene_type:complete